MMCGTDRKFSPKETVKREKWAGQSQALWCPSGSWQEIKDPLSCRCLHH